MVLTFFLRYVDNTVRTIKVDPGIVLEAAKKLHPNLQFTIDELDSNGNLALKVNFDSGKRSCGGIKNQLNSEPI